MKHTYSSRQRLWQNVHTHKPLLRWRRSRPALEALLALLSALMPLPMLPMLFALGT